MWKGSSSKRLSMPGSGGHGGIPKHSYTYTTIDDPLATGSTYANGINDLGQIVGWYQDADGFRGYLYSDGTYTKLHDPLALSTFANDINNLGQIVGSYSNLSGTHGFLLSGGTYITLDNPVAKPGTTQALGINDAGQIVGQYSDASNLSHAFLYSGGAYTTIDPPSVPIAGASGINDAGQIV